MTLCIYRLLFLVVDFYSAFQRNEITRCLSVKGKYIVAFRDGLARLALAFDLRLYIEVEPFFVEL